MRADGPAQDPLKLQHPNDGSPRPDAVAKDLLVRQRSQLINALRGHLTEFGLAHARARRTCPS